MQPLVIPTSLSFWPGSMVLNQSLRDSQFDFKTEFIPVSLEGREDLRQAQASVPWVWSWKDGHICRSH